MVHTYKYRNVVWTDMENPTRDEVRDLMKKHDISPLVAEELLLPSPHSKADRYADSIYLVLHFPAFSNARGSFRDRSEEIDFVIGRDYIVTARYGPAEALRKFSKMFEVNSVLDHNGRVGEHGGFAFYYMMRELYREIADGLDAVRYRLDEIEAKVFRGDEREMVFELSNTWRELLAFKHATSHHKEILDQFASASRGLFGEEFIHYAEATAGEYAKVGKTIQGLSESLGEMRETNNSLLEAKQNRIMMTFTSITIIGTFLNIMASWFLLDSTDNPVNHLVYRFWGAGLIMLAAAVVLAVPMRLKKWL